MTYHFITTRQRVKRAKIIEEENNNHIYIKFEIEIKKNIWLQYQKLFDELIAPFFVAIAVDYFLANWNESYCEKSLQWRKKREHHLSFIKYNNNILPCIAFWIIIKTKIQLKETWAKSSSSEFTGADAAAVAAAATSLFPVSKLERKRNFQHIFLQHNI